MVEEPPTDEHEQQPTPGPRPRRPRRRSAAERVRSEHFPVAMRGYERTAVDAWREGVAQLVERLEDQAPRDSAVKRALDEVGRETSSILQRAHEAAEEITARSRSQADGRLRRAEGEAEITIREAEERAEQLEHDARGIWDERARLIEEMRRLADEVLGVADAALERMPLRGGPEGREEESEGAELAGLDTEENAVLATEDGGDLDTDERAALEAAEGSGGQDSTLDEAEQGRADQPTRIVSPGEPRDAIDQTTVESPVDRPEGRPPPDRDR